MLKIIGAVTTSIFPIDCDIAMRMDWKKHPTGNLFLMAILRYGIGLK